MCGERGETVQHIICECKKLAQRECKRRHGTVAKLVDWKLCEKHSLERKEKWYEHCLGVVEDDNVKLIQDINIQCDDVMEARRPDLNLVNKKAKSCVIIDVAISGDGCRIRAKEFKKIEKHQNLKRELKSFCSLKKVEVVSVAVGCISKDFSGWTDTLSTKLNIGMVQKSVLLRTARIITKVLDM